MFFCLIYFTISQSTHFKLPGTDFLSCHLTLTSRTPTVNSGSSRQTQKTSTEITSNKTSRKRPWILNSHSEWKEEGRGKKKHEQHTAELRKVLIWLTKGCSEDKCCCSWPWDGSHQLTRDWYHAAYIRKCKSGCVIPGQPESDLVKTQSTSCWKTMSKKKNMSLKALKIILS